MSRQSLFRFASESEDNVLDPNNIVVGDELLEQVADELATPLEDGVGRLGLELDEISNAISDGISNTEALLSAQDAVAASTEVGMRAAEAESVLAAVNALRNAMKWDKLHLSFESAREARPQNARRLAQEGLWTTIKDIFAAIIGAIKRFGQWVADFFRYLFSSESRRERSYNNTVEEVKDAEKKMDAAKPGVQRATEAALAGDANGVVSHIKDAVQHEGGNIHQIEGAKMASYVLEMKGLATPDKTTVNLLKFPYLSYMGKSPVAPGTRGEVGKTMMGVFMNSAYLVQELSEAIVEAKELGTYIHEVLSNLDHEEARKLAVEKVQKVVTTMGKKQQGDISAKATVNELDTVYFRRLAGDWAIRLTMPSQADDLDVFQGKINDIIKRVSQCPDNVHIKQEATVPLAKVAYKGGVEKVMEIRAKFMELKIDDLTRAADALTKAAEAASRKFNADQHVDAKLGHLALGMSNLLKNYSLVFATTGMEYMHHCINDWMRYYEMSAHRQASTQRQIEVLVKKMVAVSAA